MIVDCAVYEDGRRRDGRARAATTRYEACREPGAFAWIGLYEPTEEEFDSIRREFDLHALAVEDAIHAHQRPKLEVYGDMVFIVLKTARYVDREEVVEFGEILIFLGDDYIITVRHGEASELHGRAQAARGAARSCCSAGPARCCTRSSTGWSTTTRPRSTGLGEDIEEVENEVFSDDAHQPGGAHLQAQARGARVQPRRGAAGGAGRPPRPGQLRP